MQDQRNELGNAIKSRRKALGLTQEQLASLSGCRRLLIQEIEGGKTNVRLAKLLNILRALGLQLTLEPGKLGLSVRNHESN